MNKLYMGIDIGAISTKGVIIDKYDNIIASTYLFTEGNPIKAVKSLISEMKKELDLNNSQVISVGVTGSARKLIGTLLEADVIKNEITAQAIGTVKMYPDVRTIIDIGGQDSKVILVNNGVVVDYAMNTLCAAGTGSFITSLARRLGVNIEDVDELAMSSEKKVDIDARCIVFAETDLINKVQAGYRKEDILAGVCQAVALNYLNNVAKGKKIQAPIVFNGGVSKNMAVVESLKRLIGEKVIVNKNSHLMGALGVAILARNSKHEKVFNFDIDNYKLETKITNCCKCSHNCEIVTIYKNDKLIDYWGNRCVQEDKLKLFM